MPDLKTQLADYLEHAVERVDLDDIFEERLGTPPVQPVQPRVVGRRPAPGRAIAAAAVVVLAAIGGLSWLSRTGDDENVSDRPSQTIESASALVVTDVIDLGRAIPPRIWGTDRLVDAHGYMWVGIDETRNNGPAQPGALVKIDPDEWRVVTETAVPAGVIDIVADSTAVWALIANDTVVRVDPASGQVTDTINLGLDIGEYDSNLRSDLTFGGGDLWVAGGDGLVGRIDVPSRAVEVVSTPDRRPADLWLGEADGSLWGWRSHRGDVIRIDLATDEIEVLPLVNHPESWAVLAEGAIWSIDTGRLARLDIATSEVSWISVSGLTERTSPSAPVVVDGGLWTVGESLVVRIDIRTGEITDEFVLIADPVDDTAWGVMAAGPDGVIWTIMDLPANPTLSRVDTGGRADVVSIGLAEPGQPFPYFSGGSLVASGREVWVASPAGEVTRVLFDGGPE